jgi:hypothetical protein
MISVVLSVLLLLAKSVTVVLCLLLLRIFVWAFNMVVIAPMFDPLKDLPGPAATFFENHFSRVLE